MHLSKEQKDAICMNIREHVIRLYHTMPAEERGPIYAYCPFWAWYTVLELRKAGIPALLQAGTAHFRAVSEENDDGVKMTHFGYQFDADSPVTKAMLATGSLPEMHVWAAYLPSTVVDCTVCFLPEMCRRITNQKWEAPLPPAYYWHDIGENREELEAVYQADIRAIALCHLLFLYKFGTREPGL